MASQMLLDLSLASVARMYDVLGMPAGFAEFAQANESVLTEVPGFCKMPMLPGLTCMKVLKELETRNAAKIVLLPTFYRTNDLDAAVTKNDRHPSNGPYAISFCRSADDNLKEKSAKVLCDEGVKGVTLLEYLSLEFCCLLSTGELLDEGLFILCTGSRFSNGKVPLVFTLNKKVVVNGESTELDKGPKILTRQVEVIAIVSKPIAA